MDGPNNVNVVLENVNVQNSVQDLKLILQEYPFVSHFTSYHLEAITLEKSKIKKKKHKARKVLESRKLDPFASLETLPNNQRIRIVPDNYNPNTGRLHVRQLRYVLNMEVPVDAKNYELDPTWIPPAHDTSSANSKGGEDNDKQNDMGELRRKAQIKILDASKKVDDSQLPIMGTLSNFFHENWNDFEMRSPKKLTRKSDDGEARRNNSSERDTKASLKLTKKIECLRIFHTQLLIHHLHTVG